MKKVWLHELTDCPGGKIRGLAQLAQLGIPVPPTLTILDIFPGNGARIRIEKELSQLSAPYIVRSSVSVEDDIAVSYAGFFQSKPGLQTEQDVRIAIDEIVSDAFLKMKQGYGKDDQPQKAWTVSVMIQSYIKPAIAGVMFTADPITQRRDKIIVQIEHGSDLPDNTHGFEWYKQSGPDEKAGSRPPFTLSQMNQLYSCALLAEEKSGRPVDIEWVIGEDGKLAFLQLRPITTLDPVHWNELDDQDHGNYSIYSLSGITEMLPNAITPLTDALVGDAIDEGLRDFAKSSGIPARLLQKRRFIKSFYGRIFLNLTALYDFARFVSFSKRSNLEMYTLGYKLNEPEIPLQVNLIRASLNFLKQIQYFVFYSSGVGRLEIAAKQFLIPASEDSAVLYQNITGKRLQFIKLFTHYYRVLAYTTTVHYIASRILAKGQNPDEQTYAKISNLVEFSGGAIGSEPLKELEQLAEQIRRHENFLYGFSAATEEDAWIMLTRFAPDSISRQFQRFIGKHGHRSSNETELMEPSWKENHHSLVKLIRYILSGPRKEQLDRKQIRKRKKELLSSVSGFTLFFLNPLLKSVRKGMARREEAKSLIVRMESRIREAYVNLSNLLVAEGKLDSSELIYFLRHDEISELLNSENPERWNLVAAKRQLIFQELRQLRFKDVYNGIPVPEEADVKPEQTGIFTLKGLIGSPGLVKGKVRVILQMEDADQIVQGEILVMMNGNTGLAPYFNRISGLIMEIGHPLSHGAIIAREFGIPAILGVRNITRILQTGDEIILDAEKGIIERLT